MRIKLLGVAILALVTTGCAGVPPLEFRAPGQDADVATRLVSHLLCEISGASTFPELQAANYTAVASLTVKGEDNAGAAPALSFNTPFNSAVPSFYKAAIIGGEFSKKRERVLSQEVTLKLADVNRQEVCAQDTESRLLGSFGVAEILDRRSASGAPGPYNVMGRNVTKFGSQVQFTVRWGVSGGPNLVRVHFRGPNDKGVLSASRTDTSTLIVAFARPVPPPKPSQVIIVDDLAESLATPEQKSFLEARPRTPEDEARRQALLRDLRRQARSIAQLEQQAALAEQSQRAAEAEARALIQQMILQNLTLTTP